MLHPHIHLIKPQETNKNLNAQFSFDYEVQLSLANGNTQFIIQLCNQLKYSYSLPTIALQIAAKFFHIRCYINYDRFLILCACLLLAAKFKDMDLRLKNLCYCFYKVISQHFPGIEPYSQQSLKVIRDQICIAEAQILRTLQYDIDCTTPHQYVKKYLDLSFTQCSSFLTKKIFLATRILILDSNRVQCSLYFNPATIFVACFMIASGYMDEKPYSYLKPSLSTSGTIQEKSEEQTYREWLSMISRNQQQQIKEEEVFECIKMLNKLLRICPSQN